MSDTERKRRYRARLREKAAAAERRRRARRRERQAAREAAEAAEAAAQHAASASPPGPAEWASFAALFGIGATNDTLAKRLARILGMLGSDHDGEILAAARAATALVTRSGLTWSAVLGVDDADAPGGVAD